MCYGCWEEEGSPAIVDDKTKAAAKLIEELYEHHCSGGYLHIVTDDYNLKQHNIDWCVDRQGGRDHGAPDGRRRASLLRSPGRHD